MSALQTVLVNEFTNAVLDPDQPMLGPVRDGGRIIVNTAAGCWGPMLTPRLKGGHEVSKPVFVEGAEPGDAIVIRIESVRVTSDITSSGVDHAVPGRANGDGFVAGVCPQCGTENPETHVKGVGKDAIRCDICGTKGIEKSAPISVIGTGTNLNTAVDNALERTAALFDMSVPEVKNRVTITGAIEIGRAPGVVTASLRVPVRKLQEKCLWELVRDQ
jgi:acetamidase/formamidase